MPSACAPNAASVKSTARVVRSNGVERPGVNGTPPEKNGRDESDERSARAAFLLEEKFHGAR
jgi:hypothetical protein